MENKRVFVDFTFHANHLCHKFGICIASPEMCDCAAGAGAAACSMYPLLQHSVEFSQRHEISIYFALNSMCCLVVVAFSLAFFRFFSVSVPVAQFNLRFISFNNIFFRFIYLPNNVHSAIASLPFNFSAHSTVCVYVIPFYIRLIASSVWICCFFSFYLFVLISLCIPYQVQ